MYKVIGTKEIQDADGNVVLCEIRDSGLTSDEIKEEEILDDL